MTRLQGLQLLLSLYGAVAATNAYPGKSYAYMRELSLHLGLPDPDGRGRIDCLDEIVAEIRKEYPC